MKELKKEIGVLKVEIPIRRDEIQTKEKLWTGLLDKQARLWREYGPGRRQAQVPAPQLGKPISLFLFLSVFLFDLSFFLLSLSFSSFRFLLLLSFPITQFL